MSEDLGGKTFNDLFPQHRGVVMETGGHVDPITGPRCMVKMSEGPFIGRYIIAHTDEVLPANITVLVDQRQGKTKATPSEARLNGESV